MRYNLRVVMGIIQFAIQRFEPQDVDCFRTDFQDDSNRLNDFIFMLKDLLSDEKLVQFTPTSFIDVEQYAKFNNMVDLTLATINEKARLLNYVEFVPNVWTKLVKNVIAEGNFIDAVLESDQAELTYSLKKIQSKWLKRFEKGQRLTDHTLNADEKNAVIMIWYMFLSRVMAKRPAVVQILHTFFHMIRMTIEAQKELDPALATNAAGMSVIVAGSLRHGLKLKLSENEVQDAFFFKELVTIILKSRRIIFGFNPAYYNLQTKPSKFRVSKEKKLSHSLEDELESPLSISPSISSQDKRKELLKRALSQSEILKEGGHHSFLSTRKKQEKHEKQIDLLAEKLARIVVQAESASEEESESVLPKLSSVLRFTPQEQNTETEKRKKGSSRRQARLRTSN